MTRFEVGKTYSTRSICDYDTIFSFKILGRTAKTVTVEVHGKVVRRGIHVYAGCEQFRPFGTNSMCAIIGADDKDLTAPPAEAQFDRDEYLLARDYL